MAGATREISDLIAWAARLSRTGLGSASPAETAAYLAAKASLLEHARRQPRARRLGPPRHRHRPAGGGRGPRRRTPRVARLPPASPPRKD